MESEIEQRHRYFTENFDVISKLGEGAYGTVFKVQEKFSNVLEIIPIAEDSEEQEKMIGRCVIHMTEKYKDKASVDCWKDLLPPVADFIGSICNKDNNDSDSDSDNYHLINQLSSLQLSDTGMTEQLYLVVNIKIWDGVRVEDWIEISRKGKKNEQLNTNVSHASDGSLAAMFPNARGFTELLCRNEAISKLADGAFGTLIQFKNDRTTRRIPFAVKVIELPLDAVAREEHVRECLRLQRIKNGKQKGYCTEIKKCWREHLPKDFISSICTQDANESPEEENEFLFIVMEMCGKITLRDWMEHNKARVKRNIRNIYKLILMVVQKIHSYGMVYCDLKPENIFLDALIATEGDFGLAPSNHMASSPVGPKKSNRSLGGGNYYDNERIQMIRNRKAVACLQPT